MRYLILFLVFFSAPVKAEFITLEKCIFAQGAIKDSKFKDNFKNISDVKWSQELWERQNYHFFFRDLMLPGLHFVFLLLLYLKSNEIIHLPL